MNTKLSDYEQQILDGWQEVYQRGQLTFWILLSVSDKPRYVEEIEERIKFLTKGTISADTKSIYRALRRFYDIDAVDFVLRDGERGPDRKYYSLTNIGTNVLRKFISRNINTFYRKETKEIIKNV